MIRRHEVVNFMAPSQRGGNFRVKSVKLMYFFENLLLYSRAWFIQTKCIVIMNKEVSNKIVNSMTPWTGVLVLEGCFISHIVKIHYSFENILLYS